jgi:hypothetical protein
MTLRKIDAAGANTNVVIVSATPGAGIQVIDTGAALTEMVGDDADYYLEINLVANGTTADSAKLYMVNVAYKLTGAP